MKLHNICIDYKLKHDHPFQARQQFGLRNTRGDNITDGELNFLAQQQVADRRRGREKSKLRDYLTLQLSQNGYARPGYSKYNSQWVYGSLNVIILKKFINF